jgi:tetratricopeptide (TPR) repeat protein
MATQTEKKQRPAQQPAAATVDPLRAAAALPRDLVPVEMLAVVFVVVEVLVVWLMWPQFQREFTVFMSRRYQKRAEWKSAVKYLQKVVNEQPTNPTYLNELGNAYSRMGQYDEAIKWIDLAQQNKSSIPTTDNDTAVPIRDFSVDIGNNYFLKGDEANAEKYLRNALAVNRIDPLANFRLGELEFKRGNYQKASDYFKVVASNPQFKEEVQKYYRQIEEKLFGHIK